MYAVYAAYAAYAVRAVRLSACLCNRGVDWHGTVGSYLSVCRDLDAKRTHAALAHAPGCVQMNE